MQKKALLVAAAILMTGSLFTACKKDKDTNTDQLATLSTATITGRVNALVVDTVGASSVQNAPANTVINAWIDTRDLVVNPTSGGYARRYYTATVDGSGNYKLVIDVSKYKPATVTIMPQQFVYNQIKNTVGVIHHDSIYTVTKTYDPVLQTIPVSVYTNLTLINDINYN